LNIAGCHERVLAALERREPDRVPTMDLISETSSLNEILGKKAVPLGWFFENPRPKWVLDRLSPLLNRLHTIDSVLDQFAYDHAAASVKLGMDSAWNIYMPIWRFREALVWEDYFGRRWDVALDGKGNLDTPMYRGGLITSPADWKAWDKRDILRLPEKANRVFSDIQRTFGDKIFIFAALGPGIFENTWQPLGFERFSVAVRKEKEFLRRMIKFNEDFCCLAIEAFADAGIPGYLYGDDMAYRSGPMLNPRMLEELYGDALRRVTETAHAQGMKVAIHSCGNTYKLLDWFADCGFDGVHALEPTAGMELARVKGMVGERMCLIGNIDVSHILVDGSREEVCEAVRRAIADAGIGGGYILAPTHSHKDVSVQHLRWMLEAAEEYGQYPLAG
jgi:uroporphyrinogen decarboxylase